MRKFNFLLARSTNSVAFPKAVEPQSTRQESASFAICGFKQAMSALAVQQSFKRLANKVGGQIGGDGEATEDKDAAAEEEQERLEALREAEERRKEKHRRMEEEREKMRQSIRDKYGIKKKEEEPDITQNIAESSLNRRKKTPAEIAAEAEAEEQDDFTRWKNAIEAQIGELKQTLESKCVVQ